MDQVIRLSESNKQDCSDPEIPNMATEKSVYVYALGEKAAKECERNKKKGIIREVES